MTLWFLKVNDDPAEVFDDYDIAMDEKAYLEDENPLDIVEIYSFELAELENYEEEYALADARGYFDE